MANTAYLYADNEVTEAAVPDDLEDTVEEYRMTLIENVVELDDDLTEKYLEGEDITAEELQAALHEGVRAGQVTPVLWRLRNAQCRRARPYGRDSPLSPFACRDRFC